MHPILSTVAVLLAGIGSVACGGGGGSGSSAITVALLSTPSLDGFVTTQPTVDTSSLTLAAGDSSTNLTARLFVSFPLGGIPNGALIQSATLELVQVSVNGTPYADLGSLVIDHLDYGATLDLADYNSAALSPAFGVFSTTPVIELKTLDVKTRVEADIAALRLQSQYRLRFGAASDGNVDDDFVSFSANESATNKPVLRITYLP